MHQNSKPIRSPTLWAYKVGPQSLPTTLLSTFNRLADYSANGVKMNEPTCTTDEYGTNSWWFNGKRHRPDGPAIEWKNGTKSWWLNGKRHRTDSPAIEYPDGTKSWWLNGKRHRIDGPAVEYADGSKEWFLNSELHRTDGPACEYPDGSKRWYLDGKRHRTDGPALEYTNGYKRFYLNGKRLTEAEHAAATKPTCDQRNVIIDGLTYKLVLDEYTQQIIDDNE